MTAAESNKIARTSIQSLPVFLHEICSIHINKIAGKRTAESMIKSINNIDYSSSLRSQDD